MINILLKYVNHLKVHLKAVILIENKKMIHFISQQCYKSYNILQRDIILDSVKSYQQELINKKYNNIRKNMEIYKCIWRTEMASIIDLIDSVCKYNKHVIDSHKMLSLLNWCNNINDCLSADKVNFGRSLWILLHVCNFEISIAHYNALLSLYMKNGHNFSIMELLMDMKSKQIYPNNNTYDICIKYYCMNGNIDKALILFKDMKTVHFYATKSIFSSLMLGYSKSGDIENVTKILNHMKKHELQSTTETYAVLISTYAELNNIVKIKEIIQMCNLKSIHFCNNNILNMYKYLKKKNTISNEEIDVILKLISINHIHIAVIALSCIGLHDKHPQFENVIRLILEHIVNNNMVINDITKLLTTFKDEMTFKKCFSILIYYSLMKNNDLSLPLLKIFKNYHLIKPHYFWPLLINEAIRHNFQGIYVNKNIFLGILDILKIMINDFNVLPCINTISEYVLPFSFGEISYTKNLLMKYNVNETMFNNAHVLSLLRKKKLTEAATYSKYVSLLKNDPQKFVNMSKILVDSTDSDLTLILNNNKSYKTTFVSMDKQLYDFMFEFPSQKTWLIKKIVINRLIKCNIILETETIERIREFLHEETTNDVVYVLESLKK
ncbi:hypothetical protein E2986_08569 [Frieseomelitta varia]|uniref:PROP1-like PPR domain-containing protein n=1 Tax=Frieseomelitta varia TaxID=561572 RepID=A0A833RQ34_9HYME|nr:hypothetical protein E2986_08569 [Frieseomelitta varia]